MLATAYALHFAKNQLVDMYCEMKRSKDEDLIADVHSFSAGEAAPVPLSRVVQNLLENCTVQERGPLLFSSQTAVVARHTGT